MKSAAQTVSDYFDELPAERKAALGKLRRLIKRIAPTAAESMQHGMAAYELNGLLCALASQKNHMALYVCEVDVVEKHRASLSKIDCGKGCIRFRALEELPLDAIATILSEAHEKRAGSKAAAR